MSAAAAAAAAVISPPTPPPAPLGFTLQEDAVSLQAEADVLAWLEEHDGAGATCLPWERAAEGRRVLQFGPARYDYDKQTMALSLGAPAIPAILQALLRTRDPSRDWQTFTQCIVNEYNADDAIPYHVDDLQFGAEIVVFCFGEARVLNMRRCRVVVDNNNTTREEEEEGGEGLEEVWSQTIRSRGCYHLSGEARYGWEHCVPTGSWKRVSITFRSMI
jgi:alkylated DNA repair dioxygenase AlkB